MKSHTGVSIQLSINIHTQVWFSNRRARLRKHTGSIGHPMGSIPLTSCQYTPSHDLAAAIGDYKDFKDYKVTQMSSGMPQVPAPLPPSSSSSLKYEVANHQGATSLHQVANNSTSIHQVPAGNVIAQMATTSMAAQVPTTMSSALQGHTISGHLGGLPGHGNGMQLQPPVAHGTAG